MARAITPNSMREDWTTSEAIFKFNCAASMQSATDLMQKWATLEKSAGDAQLVAAIMH